MNNLKNEIKRSLNLKYKRQYFSNEISSKYINLIYKNYLNTQKSKKIKLNYNYNYINQDNLLKYLHNVFYNYIEFDEHKIISLYKKFEINLSIQKSKNKKKKDLILLRYLYLSLLVSKLKMINDLQKLNVYLKIFDIIYLNDEFFFKKHQNLSELYFKNFYLIIKKYLT